MKKKLKLNKKTIANLDALKVIGGGPETAVCTGLACETTQCPTFVEECLSQNGPECNTDACTETANNVCVTLEGPNCQFQTNRIC